MPVIGIIFSKLEAERTMSLNEPMPPIKSIQYNNRLVSLEKKSFNQMNVKADVLTLSFDFMVIYTPPIASITIRGEILFLPANQEELNKILSTWRRERKIPNEIAPQIIGAVVTRGIQKATVLSDQIGVPPPIPPPPIGKKAPKDRKKADFGMYV